MTEQQAPADENIEQDVEVDETPDDQPDRPATKETDDAGDSKARIPALYKIILFAVAAMSIFAVAASYVLWMQQQQLHQQIDSLIDSRINKQLQQYAQQQTIEFDALKRQVQQGLQNNTQLSQSIQALQTQLQQRVDNDINLIEAESLLRLATNEYTLKHDIETSMLALQMADAQLARYSDQAIVQIRTSIEKEIKSLQSVVTTDRVALMKDVGVLIKRADTLPLISASPRVMAPVFDQPQEKNIEQDWKQTLQGLMKKLKPLVTIRRNNQATPPMLGIEEERLVRAVLKVRYELIRQALLLADASLLSQSIKEARAWIELYFDAQHQDAQYSMKLIEDIATAKMDVSYPPIGVALQQLKTYRTQSRERQ